MDNYIVCCTNHEHKYFIEYLQGLIKYYNAKLELSDNFSNYAYNTNDTYIFCRVIPDSILNNNDIKKILINTEQLTRHAYISYCNHILNMNIQLIDYGPENIEILNNHINIKYIPYQYNKDEVDVLKSYLNNEKIYDVGFSGAMSQRRLNILQELSNNNISVVNITGWGDERDKQIAKCKILVNIHFAPDYNVYESIRCDRWLFAGHIVVSEVSVKNEILDVNDLIIFKEYNHIVNTIKDIISNYETFKVEYEKKYNSNIDKLIELRSINRVQK